MKKGCLSGMQGAMGGRDCVTLYPWIQSPLINTWPQAELCQNTRASLFQSSGLEPIHPPPRAWIWDGRDPRVSN